MPYVNCQICKKEFYSKPRHLKMGWGKYCSKKCQFESQLRGEYISCYICEKIAYKTRQVLSRSKSGKFFCSKSCQTTWRNKYFVEEKSRNWKGGKASYRDILLRHKVLQVCRLCRIDDTRILAAHHINRNRQDNSISNLTWLCHNCHFLLHHYKDIELRLLKLIEVESLA